MGENDIIYSTTLKSVTYTLWNLAAPPVRCFYCSQAIPMATRCLRRYIAPDFMRREGNLMGSQVNHVGFNIRVAFNTVLSLRVPGRYCPTIPSANWIHRLVGECPCSLLRQFEASVTPKDMPSLKTTVRHYLGRNTQLRSEYPVCYIHMRQSARTLVLSWFILFQNVGMQLHNLLAIYRWLPLLALRAQTLLPTRANILGLWVIGIRWEQPTLPPSRLSHNGHWADSSCYVLCLPSPYAHKPQHLSHSTTKALRRTLEIS